MRVIETQDYYHMSRTAANIISAQIIIKPNSVIGLATGSTPIGTYEQLIRWYEKGDLDFSNVTTINLDEYKGIAPDNEQSYRYFMNKHLFDYINIDKTIDSHGKREIGTPKTFSSIRKIKIDKFLKRDLKQLIKNYYKEGSGDLFLFGGLKPLSPTTINRHKFSACNRCGLRPITLHQFRHSHATLLLDKGIMINEISRRLGHSKVSTTLDIYTHTDFTQEKRVYNILCSSRFNLNSLIQNLLKLNKF